MGGASPSPTWSPFTLHHEPIVAEGAQVGSRGSQGSFKRARGVSEGLPRRSQGLPKLAPVHVEAKRRRGERERERENMREREYERQSTFSNLSSFFAGLHKVSLFPWASWRPNYMPNYML